MTEGRVGPATAGLFSSDATTLLLQCVAAFILALIIVFMLTPFGAAVSPDSIAYLDIAAHIGSGLGVKSTDYALEHAGQALAVANTSWPPLYPALLALVGGAPSAFSAPMLSVVLLATTLFFQLRILQRFLSWPIALLAGLPLAITVPMLTIHTYVWSEQLFIALMTLLLFASQTYLLDEQRRLQYGRLQVVAIALLLALIFYTRYIGILFFPLLPLLYLTSGRPRHLLPAFLVGGLICGLAALALMAYNLEVSGSITGTIRGSGNSSMLEQLANTALAVAPMFVYPPRLMLVVLVSAFAAAALLYLVSSRKPLVEAAEQGAISITARLALGLALYYVVCIVVLRSFVAFDDIDVRLLGVILPYVWIGCVAQIASFDRRPVRLIAASVAAMLVMGMVVSGYLTLLDARKSWHEVGSPGFSRRMHDTYNNYNFPPFANQSRNFLAPLTGPDSVLVLDRPAVFRYTTGLTAYSLPRNPSSLEIQKLFELPARSYLIVSASRRQALVAAFVQHGAVSPEVTDAGNTVLIHLPLVLRSN